MFIEIDFLSPRFVGPRFDNHAIPLEVLKDLVVFDEMVRTQTRLLYLHAHPERKRLPKGFFDGVSIVLKGIAEGSAVPQMVLVIPEPEVPGLFPPENQQYIEKSRDHIVNAIDAAEHEESSVPLDEPVLAYFETFGSCLRDGEHIEFRPKNQARPARLNKTSRKRLILQSTQVQDYAEDVFQVGKVAESSHTKGGTFTLELRDGTCVAAPKDRTNNDVVCAAHTGYYDGLKVAVRGVGRFGRNDKLLKLEHVEQIMLLDPLDIGERIEDLRQLQSGWYDGHGQTLDADGLKWLEDAFTRHFDDARLPLPRLFPTVEGHVQAEWSIGPWEISLEIDLTSHDGEFQAVQVLTDEQLEQVLVLDTPQAWHNLDVLLQRFVSEVSH